MIADLPYRTVNGWQGKLDIYLPEGPGPFPALLYLHGGGWRMGSKAAAAIHAPFWNAMGLAVVAPSYRLTDIAPAPAAVEDAAAALDWLREHGAEYGIDADRLLIGGHSAGATLALAVAYSGRGAIKAVVAWSAHADLVAYHADRIAAGDPVEWLATSADPEGWARDLSALNLVRAGLPPTILIHSDRDPRVPYEAVCRLEAALHAENVPVALVTMRSDHHLPADHPTAEIARAHAETQAFLARWNIVALHNRVVDISMVGMKHSA